MLDIFDIFRVFILWSHSSSETFFFALCGWTWSVDGSPVVWICLKSSKMMGACNAELKRMVHISLWWTCFFEQRGDTRFLYQNVALKMHRLQTSCSSLCIADTVYFYCHVCGTIPYTLPWQNKNSALQCRQLMPPARKKPASAFEAGIGDLVRCDIGIVDMRGISRVGGGLWSDVVGWEMKSCTTVAQSKPAREKRAKHSNYSSLQYATLPIKLQLQHLHCNTLITLHYSLCITLHYSTLHYTTVHYTTVHYYISHCTKLH